MPTQDNDDTVGDVALHRMVRRLTETLLHEENGLRADARYNTERNRPELEQRFDTAAEVVGAFARALYALGKPPNNGDKLRQNNP